MTDAPRPYCWCGGLVEATTLTADDHEVVTTFHCADSVFHKPFATGRPAKVKRLYVAGPMTGYPECNYPAFRAAAARLAEAGYEVVDPSTVVSGTEEHYVDFIREDLRVMLDCHGVATLENWWESPGARNEVQVAGLLRMPVRSLGEWIALTRTDLAPTRSTEGVTS